MAPIAKGAIVWEWSGTVAANEDIEISLVANAGEEVSYAILTLITDNGAGGYATPGLWHTDFITNNDPGDNGGSYFGEGSLIIAYATQDSAPYPTGTLYTYTYTISENYSGGAINFSATEFGGPPPTHLTVVGFGDVSVPDFSISPIPEPATIAMLGIGSLCLVVRRRRDR